MVRFIVGKADADITAAVRGELISLLEKNAALQSVIYLVPDQFEYETEKAVYRILEEKELLRRFYEIRITTFSRLCAEILESGGEQRPYVDDVVKIILMHKAVSENKSELSVLKKAASRQGFCGKMVKTVSALKTSGVTAADLELSLRAITKIDKSLSEEQPVIKKLNETAELYTSYEALLDGSIDKLDVTRLAAETVKGEAHGVFSGASVFVDQFNDFTQSQLYFLKQALKKSDNITFGFTAALDSDKDVFRTPNGHISRLKQEALENGLSVEMITEDLPRRFEENSSLPLLSRYLFQDVRSHEPLVGCELVGARSVYEELDYVAAKIKELTLDKGFRYNETAVLCADVGAYGKYVESAFKKYDIPLFLDKAEPILYQPLINLVMSILRALCDFSVDTVLSCVKTRFFAKEKTAEDTEEADFDFSGEEENGQLTLESLDSEPKRGKYITLSDRDIDDFESYIYEWDMKTSHLRKAFSLKDKRCENDLKQQTAERVRKAVAVPLLALRRELAQNGERINGAEITERLYNFLVNKVGISRAIFKRCKNEENTALDAERTALYQRLWNSLVDIFNKLHERLSDSALTLEEYTDIFREICTQTTLAEPPQRIDSVLVGDIDRTRAENIRAAFIVGVSYEAFPTPAGEAGIFSEYEMDIISDKIAHFEDAPRLSELADDLENIMSVWNNSRREYCLKSTAEQYYLSLYRAYRAVAMPTEYLCVSCPDRNADGEEQVRSDVFGEIMNTFGNIKPLRAEDMSEEFYCRTLKAAKARYAAEFNRPSDDAETLRLVLEHEDKDFVKALDEIREQRRTVSRQNDGNGNFSGKHTLAPQTARLLYPIAYGATAVEKLDLCKFNFFCLYGLKIDERTKRSFTRSKRGEAIHFVFQSVLGEYSGDMEAFFALTRGELTSLSKKYLSVYFENETNNDRSEDRRAEYLFNNIANSAADVLITIQTELFARRYRPKFFELSIKRGENDKHELIDNEGAPEKAPPSAELYSENENSPSAPSVALKDNKNAPYLMTAPLTLKLDSGDEITVQGIIDRVDSFNAGENADGKPVAYVRVVDYKSAVHSFDLKNALYGVNIQMLLYLFALESANRDNPTLELRPGGVSYIPSNNKGASEEETPPYRMLAMNYHESGLFIKDEITEADLESYKKTVFDKLDGDTTIDSAARNKLKNTFEPNESNSADAEYWSDLRRDITKKVTENLEAVFSGTADALPIAYYETTIKPDGGRSSRLKDSCEYCRFSEICQNGGKNVIKLEKPKKSSEAENRYIEKNREGKENV